LQQSKYLQRSTAHLLNTETWRTTSCE